MRLAHGHRLTTRLPAATLLGQVGQQLVHGGVMGRVVNESPGLARRGQTGIDQFLQMEGQAAIGFGAQQFGNAPDSQTLLARLNQQAKDLQAGFLGQGAQGDNSVLYIHVSIIIEIYKYNNGGMLTDRPGVPPAYSASKLPMT